MIRVLMGILAAGLAVSGALAQGIGMGPSVGGGQTGVPQPAVPQAQPQPQGPGMNALFSCRDAEDSWYTLHFVASGQMQVQSVGTQETAQGQYVFDGRAIRMAIPALGFDETSVGLYADKGLLLAFQMPSVYCGMIGHELGEAVEGYVNCPKIGYIPSVGWQENAFEFYATHGVRWRQWDQLVAAADTLYSESRGVYLIEGNRVWMAFPFHEEQQFLTGTIGQNYTLLIQELEPDKGPCVPAQ